MYINRDVVNRALEKSGTAAINPDDSSSATFETVRLFYLSTYLEGLESYTWTSAKKRESLVASRKMNFTNYTFGYDLPIDCSRALELQNNEYFIVEGRILYTNQSNAVLLYIQNGRRPEAEHIANEDYPEYNELEFEAEFYNYLETRLASKLALKVTGQEKLYQTLFSEAQMIGRAASMTTKSASAAKKNGESWWTERIHSC